MKLVPSIAAVLAAQNAQASHGSWLNDNRDPDFVIQSTATGHEAILLIKVSEASMYNDETSELPSNRLDSDDARFFNRINIDVKKLKNVNYDRGARYIYEATYIGRNITYYGGRKQAAPDVVLTREESGGLADWLLISSLNNFHILFEGDPDACKVISGVDPLTGRRNPVSNNIEDSCTFENAREYCHRHGGELLLPDEYFINFIFLPVCNKFYQFNHIDKLFIGESQSTALSAGGYWMNIKRVDELSNPPAGVENKMNLQTSATFNFFRRLNIENSYKGWSENPNPTPNPSSYEYLLQPQGRQSENELFITRDDAESVDYWTKLGLENHRRDREDMVLHASEANSDITGDLNMHYIAARIPGGAFKTNQCVKIKCDDNVASNNIDQVQQTDVNCNSNAIKPLCIMKDVFANRLVCPNDILENPTTDGHCGENVQQFLVNTMFGNLDIIDDNNRRVYIHQWNNPEGSDERTSVTDWSLPVTDYNHLRLLKKIVRQKSIGQTAIEQDQFYEDHFPNLQLYINCMGDWVTDFITSGYERRFDTNLKDICENAGFVYDVITPNDGRSQYLVPRNTDMTCPCDPPAPLRLNDINAQNSGLSLTSAFPNIDKFCCADGYQFVPNPGYNNYHRVQTSPTNQCTNQCVEVVYADEFQDDYAQRIPFWERPQIDTFTLDGIPERANYRKIWFHNDARRSAHLDQTSIQGTCQRLACTTPSTPLGTTLVSTTKTTYVPGDTLTYSCTGNTNTCGTITKTCLQSTGCTAGGAWDERGSCTPATCNPYIPPNAQISQLSNSVSVGTQYRITCNTGYVVYKSNVAIGSRTVDVSCTGTSSTVGSCSVVHTHDYTCQKVFCPAPSTTYGTPLNGINLGQSQYDLDTTITYECGSGTCGTRTSRCVLSASGTSASFDTPFGICSPVTCTPYYPPNSQSFINTFFNDNINIGTSYTITCDNGYAIHNNGIATDSVSVTVNCDVNIAGVVTGPNAACQVAHAHSYECKPVFCPSPSSTFGNPLQGSFTQTQSTIGTTVSYPCPSNTCGTQTSICQVTSSNRAVAAFLRPSGTCSPKTCSPPRVSTGVIVETTGNVANGGSHTLRCEAGLQMISPDGSVILGGRTSVICDTSGLSTATCPSASDACCNAQMTADVICELPPPDCPYPTDIPHGYRMFKSTWTSVARTYSENIDGSVAIGEWIGYECDINYELTFTHNDQPAVPSQCWRQCYNPVNVDCDGNDADPNYSRINPIAVLDPLNCYCKPRTCPPITAANLGGTHRFIDPTVVSQTFYPIPGFNSVEVTCEGDFISELTGTGASSVESLVCNYNGWTSPGNCVRIGCPNPRNHEKEFYAPGLSMDHTCRSQDEINLNPGADALAFINIDDTLRSNANTIVWAESNTIGINFSRANANGLFITSNNNGLDATVVDGSAVRFHCKKGYRPYYNPDVAFASNQFGPQDGDNFVCTCENGIWECNMHCRCEDYCLA